jgi:hypothetical protein
VTTLVTLSSFMKSDALQINRRSKETKGLTTPSESTPLPQQTMPSLDGPVERQLASDGNLFPEKTTITRATSSP